MVADIGLSLHRMLETYKNYHVQSIHTAMPGVIESYDPVQQRAVVQLCVHTERNLNGGTELWPAPLLPAVPVLWPRGGGAFHTWPLRKGDHVLVIHMERSTDEWWTKGGVGVDPKDNRDHALEDTVCLPGYYPLPGVLKDPDTENISMGFEDKSARFRINPNEDVVEVGGNADFIALASKVEAALRELKAAITNAVPVPGSDGGAGLQASLAGLLENWPPSVGARKAKAE